MTQDGHKLAKEMDQAVKVVPRTSGKYTAVLQKRHPRNNSLEMPTCTDMDTEPSKEHDLGWSKSIMEMSETIRTKAA